MTDSSSIWFNDSAVQHGIVQFVDGLLFRDMHETREGREDEAALHK